MKIEVWRHDYTSDTGKTAVQVTVDGKIREVLFEDFEEATEIADALIELFELERANPILYEFSGEVNASIHAQQEKI